MRHLRLHLLSATSALTGPSSAADIRDLISVEDVMEELGYGPNGGLVYCMEYVLPLKTAQPMHRKLIIALGADTWFRTLTGCKICSRNIVTTITSSSTAQVPCGVAVFSFPHASILTLLHVDYAGQIELYSHLPVMKQLCEALKDWGFAICGVYLVRQRQRRTR